MAQQARMSEGAGLLGAEDVLRDLAAQRLAEAQPPVGALTAFVHALASARYGTPRLPTWWLAQAMQLETGMCCHCGARVGDLPMLDPIIPIVAGGPHSPHAVVLCCKRCRVSRGRKDLLLWKPDAPDVLKTFRTRMGLEAWNHLARDPATMKTKDEAEAVLGARWSRPRFYCHAAAIETGGFIGWRDRAQVPTAVFLRLIFEHHAGHLHAPGRQADQRHGDSTIFWIPNRHAALEAIWDVIECNGLVRPVHLGEPLVSADGLHDPSDDWQWLLPTASDLARRQRR